jgi:hypothetical protein
MNRSPSRRLGSRRGRAGGGFGPRALALTGLLAVLAAGCLEHDPAVPAEGVADRGGVRVLDYAASGLEQEVRIEPASLGPGDTLVIRSQIRNRGTEAARIEARACGLDVESRSVLANPSPPCGGWATNRLLGPGSHLEREDRRELRIPEEGPVVRVRVRRLVMPERWIELEIPVRR